MYICIYVKIYLYKSNPLLLNYMLINYEMFRDTWAILSQDSPRWLGFKELICMFK